MNKLMILLFLFSGCGTAKDVYIDKRIEVCEQKCALKYGKYDREKKTSCVIKCKNEILD